VLYSQPIFVLIQPNIREANLVLNELEKSKIKQLHKENPFSNERNAKTIGLYRRGEKYVLFLRSPV